METGEVVFYNNEKGFGFIRSDDSSETEIFFHIRESLYKKITIGDEVIFKIVPSKNKPGSFIAVDVEKIKPWKTE